MSHTFEIGDRVLHIEEHTEGTIVELTTLGEVVEGDCEEDEKDQPWYVIEWDEFDFEGQESEYSLIKI